MNAVEARSQSMVAQYNAIMKEIEKSKQKGKAYVQPMGVGAIYPEVAESLAAQWYDVYVVLRDSEETSYTQVSWRDAREGRKGTITYEDERKASNEKKKQPLKEESFKDAVLGIMVPYRFSERVINGANFESFD